MMPDRKLNKSWFQC